MISGSISAHCSAPDTESPPLGSQDAAPGLKIKSTSASLQLPEGRERVGRLRALVFSRVRRGLSDEGGLPLRSIRRNFRDAGDHFLPQGIEAEVTASRIPGEIRPAVEGGYSARGARGHPEPAR